MDDWKIRTPRGKEYAFDTAEEARAALPEHHHGSTLWMRRAYCGLANTTTVSPCGWQKVT
ncbi:hypothetical protein ACFVSN_44365 [Kitasatospora sp. NPDC057904]|uniref:hypothetical protein n=1 Tax=unclassified Kitasatospora TaxID=2633591 RepID=UPI0036DE900A